MELESLQVEIESLLVELETLLVDLHIRMLEALLFFLRKERKTANIRLYNSTMLQCCKRQRIAFA